MCDVHRCRALWSRGVDCTEVQCVMWNGMSLACPKRAQLSEWGVFKVVEIKCM